MSAICATDSQSGAILESFSDSVGEIVLPQRHSGRHLYVGNLSVAESFEFMNAAGVTHVLTAAGRLQVELPPQLRFLTHSTLDLADHPTVDLLAVLGESLAFCDMALCPGNNIDAQECVLLVHCASGVSRSVAICVAFLITRYGLSYDEALAAVRVNRVQACPNIGFQRQLRILEDCAGDLQAAIGRWSKRSGLDVMAEALSQREAANKLHATLDEQEELIASARSAVATDGRMCEVKRQAFLQLLELLQSQIDCCLPDEQSSNVDRAAKTIKRAAAQKVARLIADLGT